VIPEDLSRRNHNQVTTPVVPADVHQSNEVALPVARNRKYATKMTAVQLLIGLLTGDLQSVLLVGRHLDEPRFQMRMAWIHKIRADRVVHSHNPLLFEIVALSIVPRMRNLFSLAAIS
jgi:hypothetical protein